MYITIIINNDKILIRLNSLDYRCKRINFKYFNYIKDEDFLIEEVIDQVNFSLDSYSYFFLINVEEEELHKNKERKFKRCLHYYLIPTEFYKIDKEEKERKKKEQEKRLEITKNLRNTKTYSGKYWVFANFTRFNLKYNNRILDEYNIGFPFVNC